MTMDSVGVFSLETWRGRCHELKKKFFSHRQEGKTVRLYQLLKGKVFLKMFDLLSLVLK